MLATVAENAKNGFARAKDCVYDAMSHLVLRQPHVRAAEHYSQRPLVLPQQTAATPIG